MQRFINSLTRFVKPICQKLISRYETKISTLESRLNRISTANDRHLIFITKILQKVIKRNVESRDNYFVRLKSNLQNSENIIFRLAQKEVYHEDILNLNQRQRPIMLTVTSSYDQYHLSSSFCNTTWN